MSRLNRSLSTSRAKDFDQDFYTIKLRIKQSHRHLFSNIHFDFYRLDITIFWKLYKSL